MGCYGPAGFVAALLGPNADAFVERVTAWFVVINVKITERDQLKEIDPLVVYEKR